MTYGRKARLALIDEHEVFRRGLLAVLVEEPWVELVHESAAGPAPEPVDVAVVSPRGLQPLPATVPAVVCCGASDPPLARRATQPVAIVERDSVRPDELLAAARALAAGLRVGANGNGNGDGFDVQSREILRMLSAGGDTRGIAESLYYSERTVKGLIRKIEDDLGARTRAEAVAKAIRLGLI